MFTKTTKNKNNLFLSTTILSTVEYDGEIKPKTLIYKNYIRYKLHFNIKSLILCLLSFNYFKLNTGFRNIFVISILLFFNMIKKNKN